MKESLNASRFGKALSKDRIKGARSSSPWKTSFEEAKIKATLKIIKFEKIVPFLKFCLWSHRFVELCSLWKSFGLVQRFCSKRTRKWRMLRFCLGKHIYLSLFILYVYFLSLACFLYFPISLLYMRVCVCLVCLCSHMPHEKSIAIPSRLSNISHKLHGCIRAYDDHLLLR